ncbi:MAG: response regulator [Candidatus Lokiarchaeota archaeon]|nr:response regulator [Candidatus Lokiarchaeota archaeon]
MSIINEERRDQKEMLNKILVVDDEPSIRKSLKSILERHHYQVDTAEKYTEIKDSLFTQGYDALILDIILPEINGVEILHTINKNNLNLPTIMLTGAPSLETARESVKYGAFDYLIKPVEPATLLNQLKNAVHKKHLVDTQAILNKKLKRKNEELEDLVDKKTKELRISETRYRTIVETVQEMIAITDENGKIIYTNVSFLDVISEGLGKNISTKDVINKNINDIIANLHDLPVDKAIEKVAEGQEFDFMTCNCAKTSGIKKNMTCSLRGIFNEDLKLTEIIFILNTK